MLKAVTMMEKVRRFAMMSGLVMSVMLLTGCKVTIESPANGSVYDEGEVVRFEAEYSGTGEIKWQSDYIDLDGNGHRINNDAFKEGIDEFGKEYPWDFNKANLPAGTHTITAYKDDGDGHFDPDDDEEYAQITITIRIGCDSLDCSHLNNECTYGYCDPATVTCVAQTYNDRCEPGESCDERWGCGAYDVPDCDDQIACTNDYYIGLDDCTHVPVDERCHAMENEGYRCNPNVGCVVPDCSNDTDCAASTQCHEAFCNTETWQCEERPLDDGTECDDGVSSVCMEGVCAPIDETCDDGIACTEDVRISPTECGHIPSDQICEVYMELRDNYDMLPEDFQEQIDSYQPEFVDTAIIDELDSLIGTNGTIPFRNIPELNLYHVPDINKDSESDIDRMNELFRLISETTLEEEIDAKKHITQDINTGDYNPAVLNGLLDLNRGYSALTVHDAGDTLSVSYLLPSDELRIASSEIMLKKNVRQSAAFDLIKQYINSSFDEIVLQVHRDNPKADNRHEMTLMGRVNDLDVPQLKYQFVFQFDELKGQYWISKITARGLNVYNAEFNNAIYFVDLENTDSAVDYCKDIAEQNGLTINETEIIEGTFYLCEAGECNSMFLITGEGTDEDTDDNYSFSCVIDAESYDIVSFSKEKAQAYNEYSISAEIEQVPYSNNRFENVVPIGYAAITDSQTSSTVLDWTNKAGEFSTACSSCYVRPSNDQRFVNVIEDNYTGWCTLGQWDTSQSFDKLYLFEITAPYDDIDAINPVGNGVP